MLQSLMFGIFLAACGGEEGRESGGSLDIGQEIPDYTATGGVGSPCRVDADCDGDFLLCDLTLPGVGGTGVCTQVCTDQPDPEAEAEACGEAGATCLSWTEEGEGFCTSSCDADADPGTSGSCAKGQICTNNGIYREPDTAGCAFFCHEDDDCGPYRGCDLRVGECVSLAEVDRSALLPDGSVCDPNALDDTWRSTECRGSCLPLGQKGLCASFVDLAVASTCPDEPDRIAPRSFDGDNQAICTFAICASDDDCGAETSCESCPFGGRCCMP